VYNKELFLCMDYRERVMAIVNKINAGIKPWGCPLT
jgi:hypothetical protein